MASENETVMAVCAEWRACIEAADPSVWNDERIAGLVKTTKAQQLAYLDRIEAAAERELAEFERKCTDAITIAAAQGVLLTKEKYEKSPVGNAAAMREALNDIVGIAKIALNVNCVGNSNYSELWSIIDKCKSALSAPPRQCDVGTPEEQATRLDRHCENTTCNKCPARLVPHRKGEYDDRCVLKWAQMPYEAKEGGAE